MADIFLTVNQLSVLLAGRRPEWTRQVDASYPNGAPELTAAQGVSLRDAPRTSVLVDLRELVRQRTGRIAVRVLDLTATYRIAINGNNVDFDAAAAAAATLADVVEGWRDAINADGTVGPLVTATAEDLDEDGNNDTLKVFGKITGGVDYTIGASVTVGTAELDVVADASSCSIRMYLSEKPPVANAVALPNVAATGFLGKIGSGDYRVPNGALYAVDFRGFAEIFDTGGMDRMYIEIFSLLGPADVVAGPHTLTLTPRITIGPAIQE